MDFSNKDDLSFLRYPIMGVGFIALLLAILGGLRRIGFSLSWVPSTITFQHGGLMVSSFLGTVIAMERAVAIPISGSLLAPLLTAIGTLILLSGYNSSLGILLITISSFGLLVLLGYIYNLQPSLHNLVLIAGGLCWCVGNLLWWFNVPVHLIVDWWLGFLIFVVAAERLELNRLLQFSAYQKLFFLCGITLGLLGMTSSSLQFGLPQLTGAGFFLLALWLIRNDMVQKTLFVGGERGFTGWCLFTGYFWLGFGGLLIVLFPSIHSGFLYDAYLHSIFVGFVFTMIFGHAFIIMPGVLDLNLTYHSGFYVPLTLLEVTLLMRIGGDLLYNQSLRQWGALGNGLSIILFLLMLAETQIRNASR